MHANTSSHTCIHVQGKAQDVQSNFHSKTSVLVSVPKNRTIFQDVCTHSRKCFQLAGDGLDFGLSFQIMKLIIVFCGVTNVSMCASVFKLRLCEDV